MGIKSGLHVSGEGRGGERGGEGAGWGERRGAKGHKTTSAAVVQLLPAVHYKSLEVKTIT